MTEANCGKKLCIKTQEKKGYIGARYMPTNYIKNYASYKKKIAEEIEDFDVGTLSTSSFNFYSRLDWRLWRGSLSVRKNDELVPTPDDSVMVLFLPKTPEIDINNPLSIEWRDGELW